jgi:hypothetical protein
MKQHQPVFGKTGMNRKLYWFGVNTVFLNRDSYTVGKAKMPYSNFSSAEITEKDTTNDILRRR